MLRSKSFKRLASFLTAFALILSMGLSAVPQTKAASGSVTTVWLNPLQESPFHNGEFQGWGTSLCWWANRIGYSESLTQQAAKAFYSEEGLSLDIGRYNIGGGDDPTHTHIDRLDSIVPGVWETFTLSADGNNVTSMTYDVTNDQNQLNVAKAALAVNPNVYFEGFSNSAPYFMTNSGCTSGAATEGVDNLKSSMYDDFAKYIADATKLLAAEGIHFQSYSPINEPENGFWCLKWNSGKQEGCYFTPGASQSKIFVETRKALDAAGLNDVLVAGLDESYLDATVRNVNRLSSDAIDSLNRIDTHSYGGTQRREVKSLALSLGVDLWMSEVDGTDDSFTAGSGDMVGALGMAKHILADMNEMQPAAWVMWNIIDIHQDADAQAPSGNYPDNGASWYDPNGKMWGMSMADHDTQTLILSQKYYGFGQFSRYINPGDTLISSSDTTLAAYNKKTGDIKIVACNYADTDAAYVFDLSAFANFGTTVEEIRTSGSYENGEHWATITGEATLSGTKLSTTLKANSITTYIIKGNGPVTTGKVVQIPDGVYTIRSTANTGYVLDVSEWSREDGGNIHLWSDNDGPNQKFMIQSDGNGYYTIFNVNSGKYLDVTGWGTANGTNIIQYSASGGDNQKWSIAQNLDGTYTLFSKYSCKALDLNEAKVANGQNIQIWTPNGTSAQKWILDAGPTLENGVYRLGAYYNSSYVLNVRSNSTSNGANAWLWEVGEFNSDKWSIQADGHGYYTIVDTASQNCLDVDNAGTTAGTNVQLYKSNGTDAQKWMAVGNADGTWTFYSKCNNLCLDLVNSTVANGTNVQVWTATGGEAQKWWLESAHVHNYTMVKTEATCTAQGYTTHTCSICGFNYKDSYVDALGHSWNSGTITTSATCTTAGSKLYTCTRCGITKTESIPATGHTVVTDPAKAATQTQTGLTEGSHCSVCGTVLVAQQTTPVLPQVNYSNLPSGVYTIANMANSNYQLDVSGQSTSSGANVHIWSAHTANSQKWIFWNMGNGYYTIQNLNSGKYLDASGGAPTSGANITQYDYNGGNNQQWKIVNNGDGSCTIVSRCGNIVIDMSGGGQPTNGKNIQVWTSNGSSAQKWILMPQTVLASGTYTIANSADTNYCMDVSGVSQDNGANVHVWWNYGNDNQKFRIEAGADGYYTITAVHSGKALDVNEWGTSNGTNVQQYESNGGDNQKWLVIPYNGSYIFVSKCNGKALDMSGGGQPANGTNVQCWTINKTSAQLWKLS